MHVDRIDYTPRDIQLKDRKTYLLDCELTVMPNSYLLSSAIPIQIEDKSSKIREKIKLLRETARPLDINEIDSLATELAAFKRSRDVREFSKIGDKYVIPSSSLKGAIRSRIEYKLVQKGGHIKSCYIIEGDFFEYQATNHRKFWSD
ncbi:MAG: RAMP superfamily CRISPR-associated protein, partial [Candidatus Nitrosocaldus sp.]|nr:RAMP superfamily CRISPR-associated protein [Candidatus Nitrosocaldus sp.]MDW8275905.1 RAMP superfamily CRISPR-associated protein [Candidatus Nitrosocaldus sp.]